MTREPFLITSCVLPPALPAIVPDALTARLAQQAQVYVVGGAVRDALLQEPAGDRDWVVVGASAQQMLDLGFRPVGQDFPVFLHPETQDEFALARTERKSAPGYGGFVFHADKAVTLEQDLLRRDLTLNAMAQTLDGVLIDPYGGWRDLQSGVLRHVSPAFTEDPLRVLRLARLAARWPHFSVAPETQTLLEQLAVSGELQALVPERLWREMARALLSRQPSRYGQVLGDCGAWEVLLSTAGVAPGVAAWTPAWQQAWLALDEAVWRDVDQCWALLWLARSLVPGEAGETPSGVLAQGHRVQSAWRVPSSAQDLLACAAREWAVAPGPTTPRDTLDALNRIDVWRRPQRALALWTVLQSVSAEGAERAQRQRTAWQLLHNKDQRSVIQAAQQQGLKGAALGAALDAARCRWLAAGSEPDPV